MLMFPDDHKLEETKTSEISIISSNIDIESLPVPPSPERTQQQPKPASKISMFVLYRFYMSSCHSCFFFLRISNQPPGEMFKSESMLRSIDDSMNNSKIEICALELFRLKFVI